jgi:hypothetical protein
MVFVVVVVLLLLVFVLRIVRRRFQKCKTPGTEWNNSPDSQLRVLQAFNPGGSPSGANTSCFLDYHDNCMFGLCREDSPAVGKNRNTWQPASEQQRRLQRDTIQ